MRHRPPRPACTDAPRSEAASPWVTRCTQPSSASLSTGLEIELQADYDDGAIYGIGAALPGYSEVRYVVTVESSAPEADVLRVLDEGDAHSPYLDVFRRAQKCTRDVHLKPARGYARSPRLVAKKAVTRDWSLRGRTS